MKKILFRCLVIFFFVLILVNPERTIRAQSPDGNWSEFVNISMTPASSTFPTIAADHMGHVHVFWSEDVGGSTGDYLLNGDGTHNLDPKGNPVKYMQDAGNTLFYSQWDGNKWSKPQDIFYNKQGTLEYPDAVVDSKGILHVVWCGGLAEIGRLFYSSVPVAMSGIPNAWSQPVVLAEPILYAYYPVSIAADALGGLHITYSALGEAGLVIINSYDGGSTWSKPNRLISTSDPNGRDEGIAPIRLVVDKQDRIHVTFSLYGKDGNGKAIYYAQSLDRGKTWSEPFKVAAWQPGLYEVDWLTTGISNDEIHLIWEGGKRAFINELISRDGGKTWDNPQQILPNLTGENGYSDIVTDSANLLHLLVVQRGVGADLAHGIWYSSWNGNQWEYPLLLGSFTYSLYSTAKNYSSNEIQYILRGTFTGGGLRYQRAVIVNGNELFVVVVNEFDGDIYTSKTFVNATAIAPKAYPPILSKPTANPEPTQAIYPTPTKQVVLQQDQAKMNDSGGYFSYIFISALLAGVFVFGFGFIFKKLGRN